MMKRFNRELLVLMAEDTNQHEIDQQVESLHELLFSVEQIDELVIAHELVDVYNRKISSSSKKLRAVFKSQILKPFVFLNNLN